MTHSLQPILFNGQRRMWCSNCASWDCSKPARKLPTLGKVYAARLKYHRQLSAGTAAGEWVIEVPGGWVAWRCRQFYDRREQPSPWPPEELGSAKLTTPQQYQREFHRYSVNTAVTSTIDLAKRWRTRQAAHKANKTVHGRVRRATASELTKTLFEQEGAQCHRASGSESTALTTATSPSNTTNAATTSPTSPRK